MEKLRATEVCTTGEGRVIAIEALRCRRLQAAIEPVAIVICAGDGSRVIDLASTPVSLEMLIDEVPGLAVMLGSGH